MMILPGNAVKLLSSDEFCQTHQDLPAEYRVIDDDGNDSYMCQDCYDEYIERLATEHTEVCDWCGDDSDDCIWFNSIDADQPQRVCSSCRRQYNKELEDDTYED